MSIVKRTLNAEAQMILVRNGFLKPARVIGPPTPNVADLMEKAAIRGFELTLSGTFEEQERTHKLRLISEAVVIKDGESWTGEDEHPGFALAIALARALRATEPQQVPLPESEAA